MSTSRWHYIISNFWAALFIFHWKLDQEPCRGGGWDLFLWCISHLLVFNLQYSQGMPSKSWQVLSQPILNSNPNDCELPKQQITNSSCLLLISPSSTSLLPFQWTNCCPSALVEVCVCMCVRERGEKETERERERERMVRGWGKCWGFPIKHFLPAILLCDANCFPGIVFLFVSSFPCGTTCSFPPPISCGTERALWGSKLP